MSEVSNMIREAVAEVRHSLSKPLSALERSEAIDRFSAVIDAARPYVESIELPDLPKGVATASSAVRRGGFLDRAAECPAFERWIETTTHYVSEHWTDEDAIEKLERDLTKGLLTAWSSAASLLEKDPASRSKNLLAALKRDLDRADIAAAMPSQIAERIDAYGLEKTHSTSTVFTSTR